MIISLFAAAIENAFMSIEAGNVICMRLQMIAEGDAEGQREAERKLLEKVDAFAQAGRDVAAESSNVAIQRYFRALIQANEARLRDLQENAL